MIQSPFSILMLEDSPLDTELAHENLLRAGLDYTAERVDTREAFMAALHRACPDLILADYALPGFDGLSALSISQELCPDVPFVFLSGAIGEETAIDSLRRGATDYVLKHRLQRLAPAVMRALEESKQRLERKRAQTELAEKARELTILNAELEQFVYAASHDLREPLRTISVFSDLVAKKYSDALDKEARAYLDFIASAAQHVNSLLEDLLSYAKIPSEEREFCPVNLNELFDTALLLSRASVAESGAVITVDALPAVRGNQAQLSLVVQNLISNALKYRGSGPPRIQVTSSRLEQDCIIAVKDNGIGFDPAYAKQIFGLFKRLSRNSSPGTGLGLAICKRVIELHGGRIWAESQPDAGSTFFFSLPAAEQNSIGGDRLSAYPQPIPA